MHRPRILIVDDHSELLRHAARLLEKSFDIIGTADNGRELISKVADLHPDVVVTDISMPQLDGIQATAQLNAAGCGAKFVFLTVHTEIEFIKACQRTGALGYVVKRRMRTDLIPAINEALCDRAFLSPGLDDGSRPSRGHAC